MGLRLGGGGEKGKKDWMEERGTGKERNLQRGCCRLEVGERTRQARKTLTSKDGLDGWRPFTLAVTLAHCSAVGPYL